uniref:CCR4-NOT transcription complex subunit 8 n=1 Tax=Sarcophilus harrisii TaxID=9305 RepID=A0A7N4NSU5_SARHA
MMSGSELQLSGLSYHPVLAEGVFSGFFRMPAALVENSQVICEVWASNLEEEMRKIREIVLSYSYIAMGGLQEVADQLDLQRIGRQHQAGSDSLLTGMAFFRMKELFFEDSIDDAKYCGRLYGLGTGVAQKQNEDMDSAQEKMNMLAIISNTQQ